MATNSVHVRSDPPAGKYAKSTTDELDLQVPTSCRRRSKIHSLSQPSAHQHRIIGGQIDGTIAVNEGLQFLQRHIGQLCFAEVPKDDPENEYQHGRGGS